MTDPSEATRRYMIETGAPERDLARASEHWSTEELKRDFEVLGFAAPFALVRRRSDGARGSLEFTHSPRVYFGWKETT